MIMVDSRVSETEGEEFGGFGFEFVPAGGEPLEHPDVVLGAFQGESLRIFFIQREHVL
jgi:hypothetical protein